MATSRSGTLSDLIAIYEIENEVFSQPYSSADIEYFLAENKFTRVWVLEEEKEMIGYCMLLLVFDQAQIVKIAVRKDRQNEGYGRQLMDLMLETAKAEKCETVTLEVRVSNKQALDFYHKQGFNDLAIRKDYYRQPSEDGYLLGRGI